MATLDKTVGGTTKHGSIGTDKLSVIERTIDFAVDNMAQNDIAQMLNIPANTLVMSVVCDVERVEGESRNYAIGDGADDNGYITTTTANVLGATASGLALTEGAPNTVTGYSNGKFYAAADTIDLKAVTANGLTVGKVTVRAVVADLS